MIYPDKHLDEYKSKVEKAEKFRQQMYLDEIHKNFFGQTSVEAIQIIREDLGRFETYLSSEQIARIILD